MSAVLDFAESWGGETDAERLAREVAADYDARPISPGLASYLTLLAKSLFARNVVEVGTGTGISATALLKGMTADGILTSIDPENELQLRVKELLKASNIPARKARLIAGNPLDVLEKLTDHNYDLVFISGDPLEYVEYVEQALRLLRPGGAFVLNNVFWKGKVPDEHNDEDEPLIIREALEAASAPDNVTTAIIPLDDGLLVGLVE
jgi:predicted O-methyltransferase YrrM